MVKLYDNNILDNVLQNWQREAFIAFDKKVTHKRLKFPCIPAYQGYRLNQIRIGFAGDPRNPETSSDLADLLTVYGNSSREKGEYTALIVFFETPSELRNFSVRDFEHLFWNLLNLVSKRDKEEWLESISSDPNDPTWEYCFNKERYFIYCATPAHEKRKSRYFPYFMLAITPRWVLERFGSNSEKAKKMKEHIRSRLHIYDEVAPHPDLKWYGDEDSFEWKQYFLRDDDSTLSVCPFHLNKKENNRLE